MKKKNRTATTTNKIPAIWWIFYGIVCVFHPADLLLVWVWPKWLISIWTDWKKSIDQFLKSFFLFLDTLKIPIYYKNIFFGSIESDSINNTNSLYLLNLLTTRYYWGFVYLSFCGKRSSIQSHCSTRQQSSKLKCVQYSNRCAECFADDKTTTLSNKTESSKRVDKLTNTFGLFALWPYSVFVFCTSCSRARWEHVSILSSLPNVLYYPWCCLTFPL